MLQTKFLTKINITIDRAPDKANGTLVTKHFLRRWKKKKVKLIFYQKNRDTEKLQVENEIGNQNFFLQNQNSYRD